MREHLHHVVAGPDAQHVERGLHRLGARAAQPRPNNFQSHVPLPNFKRDATLPPAKSQSALAYAVQSLAQVGDQVVGVFQADVEADHRAAVRGLELAHVELRVAGQRQALEAAPGEAEAEQLQRVEEGVDRARSAPGLSTIANSAAGAA